MLADQFRRALDENDIGHLHLGPRDKKLKKARVKKGDGSVPAAHGAGRTKGYRQTTRHKTVAGGY